ncbi:multidrug resistance protein MdtN [Stieleria bergensis]|uniref:Multidrug resistance protein MdtN n=1 Tax=Stieleria bergensis TaxID=2528025 RepID=A0A517SWB0_9BACT|nr:multidrug resistance protein MdtN [Planctomycetes bacterium SV_7m_r]
MHSSTEPSVTDSDAGDPVVSAESPEDLASENTSRVEREQASTSSLQAAKSPTDSLSGSGPVRWDRFLLYNVAIPILLVVAGISVMKLLGKATADPQLPPQLDAASVLQSLPETRIEQVRSLASSELQLELMVDGNVVPFIESFVAAEVSGRVVEKMPICEPGTIVREGDLLIKIDDTDYQLEVDRLTKLKEREGNALAEVQQQVVNADRSIELAKKDEMLQQADLKRQIDLGGFASNAEIDQAKKALIQSQQQVLELQNQRDLLNKTRYRLESSLQLAETNLRVARTNLARCEVHSPISGVISSERVDVNAFVNRGTVLVTIEDTSKAEVAANLRMDQLYWVINQNGNDQLTQYELPQTKAIIEYKVAGRQGVVRHWDAMLMSYDGVGMDPSTRTVPVRLIVDKPSVVRDAVTGKTIMVDQTNALMRGMYVRVRLQLDPKDDLVIVPAKALRPGNKVWKFTPNQTAFDSRLKELTQKAEMMISEAKKKDIDLVALAKEQEEKQLQEDQESQGADSGLTEGTDLASKAAFDPESWTAGWVKTSQSLYPIESLLVEPANADAFATRAKKRDYWVCQAADGEIKDGDYVVLSQLGVVPQEGIAARANVEK